MKKIVSLLTAIALMATILVGATLTVSAEETNVCLGKTATADVKSTSNDTLEKLTDGTANDTSSLYRTSGSVTWSENAITIDLNGTFSLDSIKVTMYANDTDLIADDYMVQTGLGEEWNEVQAKTEIPTAEKGTYPEFLTTINPAVRADKIKVTFYKDEASTDQIRVAEIEAYGVEATDIPESPEETNVCQNKNVTATVDGKASSPLEYAVDGTTENKYASKASVSWAENAVTIDLEKVYSLSKIDVILYAYAYSGKTSLFIQDMKVETGLSTGEDINWTTVQEKTEVEDKSSQGEVKLTTELASATTADYIKITFYKDAASTDSVQVAEIEAYGVEFTGELPEVTEETNVCLGKTADASIDGKNNATVGYESNMTDGTTENKYSSKGSVSAWSENVIEIDLEKPYSLSKIDTILYAYTFEGETSLFIQDMKVETGLSTGGGIIWTTVKEKTEVTDSSSQGDVSVLTELNSSAYADRIRITLYRDEASTTSVQVTEIEALGVEASDDEIVGVTGVTYKQNGEAVSACPANGEFTVSVAYTNVESPLVLVAFYDANGNLLDVATGSAGTELQCSVSSAATISKARIFTWETTTLKPLLLTAYDYID